MSSSMLHVMCLNTRHSLHDLLNDLLHDMLPTCLIAHAN